MRDYERIRTKEDVPSAGTTAIPRRGCATRHGAWTGVDSAILTSGELERFGRMSKAT